MVAQVTFEEIVWLHALALAEGGGAPGLRDVGLLESALGRMNAGYGGQELYRDPVEKAAALLDALVRNHPFVDGNKRTALAAAATLLDMNGIELSFTPEDAVALTVGIAKHEVSLGEIVAWLRGHEVGAG